jgi:uncharacterized damage-inducible protein DinB
MQTLLSIFRTTHHVMSLSLADLTDEVARRRTRGSEGPSVTWTVAHMLGHRHKALALLGDERPSSSAASFGDSAATDGADYPTIATMRAEWQATHEALEQAFASAAPDALDRTIANVGTHGETKVRDTVAFLAWHEGYHVGVIGAVRLAAGLPGPAELALAAATKSQS